MALYRRGPVFWWKSRLRFSSVPSHHTMVRISLRTASPQQARSRAAELDLAKDAMMEQMPALRRNVKAEDMPALYKVAFERELDRVVLAQFQQPGRVDDHLAFNRPYAQYFIRSLSAFGSPAQPETITPEGDPRKLADAMRGMARLRLTEIVQKVPLHFLADAEAGPERRTEAAEDLARYWIFALLARHDQEAFDLMFGDGFFQGVHGPDFVVNARGVADFGNAERGGHIGILSPELAKKLPPTQPGDRFVGKMGDGVISGIRRPIV